MRARIRLVIDYAYDGVSYEEGSHHKFTIIEWMNAPNEKEALTQWLNWKYRMEHYYLIDNTIFPNTAASEALKEKYNETLCYEVIPVTTSLCVRAFGHKGAHSPAEQARGK